MTTRGVRSTSEVLTPLPVVLRMPTSSALTVVSSTGCAPTSLKTITLYASGLSPFAESGTVWIEQLICLAASCPTATATSMAAFGCVPLSVNGSALTLSTPTPSCCCWSAHSRGCTRVPSCANCCLPSCATTIPTTSRCQQRAMPSESWWSLPSSTSMSSTRRIPRRCRS